MDKTKFFGICLILASSMLSGAIIWHAWTTKDVGRYQFHILSAEYNGNLAVIDTKTGEVKTNYGVVLMPPHDGKPQK